MSHLLTHEWHMTGFLFAREERSNRKAFHNLFYGFMEEVVAKVFFYSFFWNQFWITVLFKAHNTQLSPYRRASLSSECLSVLSLTIPHFFSVEDCQGWTPHSILHTFCSDEPHGGEGMMSLPTNNNHPASQLSSLSLGCLATPRLSP